MAEPGASTCRCCSNAVWSCSRPALEPTPAPVHVDATLGLGGHAEAVLRAHPETVLIGLDRDTEALAHSQAAARRFDDRVHLVHAVYDELPQVLTKLGFDRVDGVLFDLGVSSLQLDEADRGFAYAQDAPLDMRMDQTTGHHRRSRWSTATPHRNWPGCSGSTGRRSSRHGSRRRSCGNGRRRRSRRRR